MTTGCQNRCAALVVCRLRTARGGANRCWLAREQGSAWLAGHLHPYALIQPVKLPGGLAKSSSVVCALLFCAADT